VTKLPLDALSGAVGRICAPVSLIVPAYLVVVMGGFRSLIAVLPGAAVCGISFALTQYLVSNYLGPQLTDILSSLAAIASLILLLLVWKPKDHFELPGEGHQPPVTSHRKHSAGEVALAWSPYFLLVIFVLLWGSSFLKPTLDSFTRPILWPGLHGLIQRMPPVVGQPSPYDAIYKFEWLAASGTACMFAALASAAVLRVSPGKLGGILAATLRQLALPLVTIASVLALAYLMNYSGATATLGLAFAGTGRMFPYFSAMLGWMGVFLTGSDTSANALFGNLQVVTANRLGLDPILMAASNSSGGVMGKMISLQSIAVAAAATGMERSQESRLFRFTAGHSVLLASLIGLITVAYAYWL
jgi:lactate permease